MTRALALGLALALSACAVVCPPDALHDEALPSSRVAAAAGPFEAGAAKVDITPTEDLTLGGFGVLRGSEGVHDPVWVRALALRRGDVTLVVVSADLVGLHNHHVRLVRERLAEAPGLRPEGILVHATHNHDGPDTMGFWALGVDDDYMARVLDALTQAAREAVAALAPARLTWSRTQAPAEGISRNRRDPAVIDRTVTALALDGLDGAPIATLVHFACHPETLGHRNHLISADFPGWLYESVEAARPGSVTVFLNGPLGGMVTTDEVAPTFEDAARIGRALGALALDALARAPRPADEVAVAAALHPVWMPIQNRRYHLGDLLGVFEDRPFEGGYTRTEVQALRFGPVTLLTMPGEVLPRLGFQLQRRISAPLPLVVSLGNDELGYLIPDEVWEDDRYRYERTVSPGPLAPVLLRRTAEAALADVQDR